MLEGEALVPTLYAAHVWSSFAFVRPSAHDAFAHYRCAAPSSSLGFPHMTPSGISVGEISPTCGVTFVERERTDTV